MKVQIQFDKPDTAKAYLMADNYFAALSDTYYMLRSIVKHGDGTKTVDEVYESFFDILDDHSIDIHDYPDFWDDVS